MVESRKITLIIEKSLVPRKGAIVFSCQSKRQGVKFPVNTGEIYIYPHAKESGKQDSHAATPEFMHRALSKSG